MTAWIVAAGLALLLARAVFGGQDQDRRSFRLGVAADPTSRQLQLRVDGLLARLKAEYGFQDEAPGSGFLAAAAGLVDGLLCRVSFAARADGEGRWLLDVAIALPGGLPASTSVRAEGVRSAVQQRLSGPDFQVGCADTDALLHLDGHPADLAAVLSNPVVDELVDLIESGGSVQGGRLRQTLWPDPDAGYDPDALRRWIRLARALSLRVGERAPRLAQQLHPSLPPALRLAAAEALVDHHLGSPQAAACAPVLDALLHDAGQDREHRNRAASALARLRSALGLSPEAGGLAVVEGSGGELALAEQGGRLSEPER